MASDPHKKAKMSPADKEAARRLNKLWYAMPKEKRPKQEQVKGLGTQSNVSQYITGKIPLNYYALRIFANIIGCKPEDIRDDLPEQQLEKSSSDEQLDQLWASYTREQKLLAIGLHKAYTQQIEAPKNIQGERNDPDNRAGSRRAQR